MTQRRLKPSDIFYSQDSIMNRFRHGQAARKMIGETLDDLVERRITVEAIPPISVTFRFGKWISFDNRRLWVFKYFDLLCGCPDIPVQETHYWNDDKYSTENGGISIRIRGNGKPGGKWYDIYSKNLEMYKNHLGGQNVNNYNCSFVPGPANVLTSLSPEPKLKQASTQRFAQLINVNQNQSNRRIPTLMMLDPIQIRYTKDVISQLSLDWPQVQNRCRELLTSNNPTPLAVYQAFEAYWVQVENEALWALKQGRGIKVSCLIVEDNDAFVDCVREGKPWLNISDIVRSGYEIQIVD
ncbi:hypothetical protein CHS0354_028506 [Potamilus streckersoni]|uniref:Uncharacterized protein n=1 Tax=Potamilus streckersoni TaxID=2493646 RepID=A0AAE0SEG0_9BIVA|nr:hypothetical protein CHS0354_028506 [Potamilus streckersoni]